MYQRLLFLLIFINVFHDSKKVECSQKTHDNCYFSDDECWSFSDDECWSFNGNILDYDFTDPHEPFLERIKSAEGVVHIGTTKSSNSSLHSIVIPNDSASQFEIHLRDGASDEERACLQEVAQLAWKRSNAQKQNEQAWNDHAAERKDKCCRGGYHKSFTKARLSDIELNEAEEALLSAKLRLKECSKNAGTSGASSES